MTLEFNRLFSSIKALLLGAGLAAGLAATADAQQILESARATLPPAMRDAGVLKVATSLQWAPFDYKSETGETVGLDISLIKLLSAKLGLKPEFTDLKFPSIVPGVSGGRFDVGVNQIGITAERAKVADFVPYFNSGYGLVVQKGRTDLDVNHLCGKSLSLTTGSSQIAVAEDISKKCVAAGQGAISMTFYPDSADTYLAVANGRGDGFLVGKATGVYISKGNPKLQMTDAVLPDRLTISGIVVAKGNDKLHGALLAALESAVEDGSYKALLDEYGVADGALTVETMRKPATAF